MGTEAEVAQRTVEANGIEFGYVEAGEGPLALLLHGFPDNAWTYEHQLDPLAAAGYRAVAPFMRGYAPTQIPLDERYDAEALAGDVAGLVRALGEESAYVIGNDWGGIATYSAMALHPDVVRRAVVINIGHPATFLPTLLNPRQVHHIFHFWFFQLEELAPPAVRHDDFAFLDYLWDYWSAEGHEYREHLDRVKRETLAGDGRLEAALGYYRALLSFPQTHPEAAERIQGKTRVPTLTIFGDEDPARELSEEEHVNFDAEYRLEIVEGAGHFVHREQPEEVNRLVVDWLDRDRDQAAVGAGGVGAGTRGGSSA
jgi:pimeloyl-ACP methyl ester carboxylesterase